MMGFGLLFLVLIVGALVYAVRWRPQWGWAEGHNSRRSAIEIVRERYARGEMSKAEYEQLRRDLEA